MKRYFLAKAGRIHGPYTEVQIESFREAGQYENFTWFWDDARSQWQPIDPAPAAPPAQTSAIRLEAARNHPSRGNDHTTAAAPQATPQAAPGRSEILDERARSISAVCYDRQAVLTGWLTHVTDGSCEFVTDSHATVPEFQAQLSVLLHLFDQSTGRSINVSGRVGHAERREGRWCYKINWKRVPDLFVRTDENASETREVTPA